MEAFSRRLVIALAALALLGGCQSPELAQQRKEEREAREAQEAALRAEFLERVHTAEAEAWGVLHPLMERAGDYKSEETAAYTGAVFVSDDFYSEALLKEVQAEGFGPYVTVLNVVDGSPAQEAGLRAGDRILEVNGKKVPKGSGAAIFAAKRMKRVLEAEEQNALLVQRGEETFEATLVPEKGVYYPVIIVASNAVDLQVDGEIIYLGLRLMEEVEAGEDMSYLLAYALAKNVMRHPKQKGRNAFFGQLLDVAAMASGVNTGGVFGSMSGNAYAHAFEVEADLIALYLLASAGYEIESYPEFWDGMLRRQNRNGELTAKDEERIQKMRQVIASIQAKLAAGEPVFPEEYLQGDVSEIE